MLEASRAQAAVIADGLDPGARRIRWFSIVYVVVVIIFSSLVSYPLGCAKDLTMYYAGMRTN